MIQEKSENQVRYIEARDGDDSPRHRDYWAEIDRAKFVRHDGDVLCGTSDELIAAIAEKEGLPESFVHDRGTGYGFSLYTAEAGHLLAAMEYAQRTGRSLKCASRGTLKGIAEECGKAVTFIGHGCYVIDGKWLLQSGSVTWNPAAAADQIASKASRSNPGGGPRQRAAYSRIPWKCFSDLCRAVDAAFDELQWFRSTYYGRSWGRSHVFEFRRPGVKAEALAYLPEIAEFYFRITRNRRYRTKDFVEAAKLITRKHLKDPLMTDGFRKFIVLESRARALQKAEAK
jgi:hypothetical protein